MDKPTKGVMKLITVKHVKQAYRLQYR